ncbi:MAG: hypothetical protein ACE145_16935 [Terriglobia bacterium]
MKRSRNASSVWGLTILAGTLAIPQIAQAGPPLICHPFDIGGAKSLPWAGGDRESGRDWRGVDPNYEVGRLVADTLALLTPETPVIVRMETLRRAAVYGAWALRDRKVDYSVKDEKVARELLARLLAKAKDAEAKGKPDALAWFDAGYLAESYKQAGLTIDVNGYELVGKAIALRAQDPEIEFAAAIITEGGRPSKEHREHFQKAISGAKDGSLLAKNLVLHFGNRGTTIAELKASLTSPSR